MYKVIIIDDEEIVRSGIRTLIDWGKMGFEICAEGKDGRDGLQKILDYMPKLVLVDIKMPGLSGIELIKKAREHGFGGQFIVLTGYSEFEYTKSAISLGVKEYLLKPIDEMELQRIVKDIYSEIQDSEDVLSNRMINEEKARKELLRQILLNIEERVKLDKKIALYKLDVSEEFFCVAILQHKDNLTGVVDHQFYEKVEELLMGSNSSMDKVLMDEYIVLIKRGMGYKKWAEMLYKGNERVKRRFGSNFLITVGHNVKSWYDLCYSYESARYLLENEFLFSKQPILTIDAIQQQRESGTKISTDYLSMLIEAGDLEGIRDSINHFKNYCLKHLVKESEIKVQVMYNLVLLKSIIEKKYGSDKCKKIEETEIAEKILSISELDELLDYYCYVMNQIYREIRSVDKDTIIKRVYYYMEKNYDKDLKLEAIAKLFNYNSSYLGKIFSKEIGENFNKTLDTIRIKNAMRLLVETDMKGYQIAEAVGFGNIDFFYTKFKKYVGISPREYKKNSNDSVPS